MPDSTSQVQDVLRLPLALFLGLFVPLLIANGLPDDLTGTLLFLVCAYSGSRFVFTVLSPAVKPVQFFAWLFFYVVDGLASLTQYTRWSWPYAPPIDRTSITTAAIITGLFILAYDGGLAFGWRIAAKRPAKAPKLQLAPRRVVVLVPIALLVSIYEFQHFGGTAGLFVSRQDRASVTIGETPATLAIHSALLSSPVFVCAYFLIMARKVGAIVGWGLTTGVLTVVALALANPVSTARYGVLLVYLGLTFARLWPLRSRHMMAVAVLVMAGLFVIFPALNAFRTATSSAVDPGSIAQQLTGGDYDAFQQTINTVDYTHAHGHSDGREELSALLFFVPRSSWHGKALDTGVTVARFEGYGFVNLSDPLQAEAYIDGGIPLVLVIGVLFGALSQRMEVGMRSLGRHVGYLGMLAPIFAVYQLIILRGSLLQAMGGIVAIAVTLRLCMMPVAKAPKLPRASQRNETLRHTRLADVKAWAHAA